MKEQYANDNWHLHETVKTFLQLYEKLMSSCSAAAAEVPCQFMALPRSFFFFLLQHFSGLTIVLTKVGLGSHALTTKLRS
jgi:hypothetical protein